MLQRSDATRLLRDSAPPSGIQHYCGSVVAALSIKMEFDFDIIILLAIIVFTIMAFVLEWMNMAVIAMVCTGLLLLFNLITPNEAISGFSNEAVITRANDVHSQRRAAFRAV